MPHMFISTIALCANLYRCAPLIVGDRFSDPKVMKYLGAKVTTDYPEPDSPPIYVMFATIRSVLDALEELGWELKQVQAVQGYYTCVVHKPKGSEGKDTDEEDVDGKKDAEKHTPTGTSSKRESRETSKSSANAPKSSDDKATSTEDLTKDQHPKFSHEQGSVRSMKREGASLATGGSDDELTDSSRGSKNSTAMPSRKATSSSDGMKGKKLTTLRSEDSVIPVQKPASEDDVSVKSAKLTRTKSDHTRKTEGSPDRKRSLEKGEKLKKRTSSGDKVEKKSSSDGGSPYSPRKVDKVSKRQSHASKSSVIEIFKD